MGFNRVLWLLEPWPNDQLPTAKEGTSQLSNHGFTAVKDPSVMSSTPYTLASWQIPGLIKIDRYIPEREMLRRITCAKTIVTEPLLLRGTAKSGQEPPSDNDGPEQNGETNEAQSNMHDITKIYKTLSLATMIKEDTTEAQVTTPPAPTRRRTIEPSLPSRCRLLSHNWRHASGSQSAQRSRTVWCSDPHPVLQPHNHRHARPWSSPLKTAFLQPMSLCILTTPAVRYGPPGWAIYSVWRPLKPVKRDSLAATCAPLRKETT